MPVIEFGSATVTHIERVQPVDPEKQQDLVDSLTESVNAARDTSPAGSQQAFTAASTAAGSSTTFSLRAMRQPRR